MSLALSCASRQTCTFWIPSSHLANPDSAWAWKFNTSRTHPLRNQHFYLFAATWNNKLSARMATVATETSPIRSEDFLYKRRPKFGFLSINILMCVENVPTINMEAHQAIQFLPFRCYNCDSFSSHHEWSTSSTWRRVPEVQYGHGIFSSRWSWDGSQRLWLCEI